MIFGTGIVNVIVVFRDRSLASESGLKDLFQFCGLQHQWCETEKAKLRQHKQLV